MIYKELLKNLKLLDKNYKIKIIGKTKFNRKIIAVEKTIDKSFYTAILVAGMHARENISCDLLMEMIKNNLFNNIDKFNVNLIIMANPDGIELQSNGIKSFKKRQRKKLLKINENCKNFSMWKANARGVDINNNFDANFGTNVFAERPSSQGFVGKKAMSERETRAIANYTKTKNTFFTISYHTKGEEIYYNFFQDEKRLKRDKKIAEFFEKFTGYKIKNVESVSSGGFKDWCVQKLKIPSLTIELGGDKLKHPIGKEFLNDLYKENKMIATGLEFAYNEFIKSKRDFYGI